ncbi:MAG TPA: 2'-5' RNA ligase family protein [Dehalococcoidia bacterium]|nr:2'-5' RNA ligase family protein [Dehalococcoidia bacterium]
MVRCAADRGRRARAARRAAQPAVVRCHLLDAGRFTAVLYLQPDDDGPLLALMHRLYEVFPDYPPYGGIHEDNVIPHLTIVDASREGGFEAVAEEVAAGVHPQLPISTAVREVAVLESDEDGTRRVRTAIPLGG